jgi:cytochrome c556
MKPQSWILVAGLAASLAACGKPAEEAKAPPPSPAEQAATAATTAAGPLEQPELTIRDMMNQSVDPSGDYLFESVQDISNDKGVSKKQPKTDADWAEVRKHWQILHDAPRLMIQAGRKAGRPDDKTAFPAVENTPAQVQELMDTRRPDWIAANQRLVDAANEGLKATEAKDVTALSAALLSLDRACERCHLEYYYPRDERAKQAAREEGLIP